MEINPKKLNEILLERKRLTVSPSPDEKLAGIDIKANVRDFSEPLPADMIKTGRFEEAKTWGEAMSDRINKQGGGFKNEFPHGSPNSPRITGKPKGG